MQEFVVSLLIFTAVFALFGLGLNLQWGFTGLVNFGHVAFMSVGAYTTVLLSLRGVPLLLATAIGAAVAAVLGLLIGLTTLRLRTDYLAIVTIGVSELLRLVAVNEDWLTRGTLGIQGIPLPLANWSPFLPTRWGMIAILGGIWIAGYWQWGQWLRQEIKAVPRSALGSSALAALAYVVSLLLCLYGGGMWARQLKAQNLPDVWLGAGLLLGTVAIALLYTWLARRVLPRFPAVPAGLAIVGTGLGWLLGLGLFAYTAAAIYDYDSNPSKNGLLFIALVLVALCYWAIERLVRSPWGRVVKAIREDEAVATALGKNVFAYKLQVLMLGGLIAGIAGALYAWQLTTVFPDNFQPLVTFNAWTIVVLGGSGVNAGTLLGSLLFVAYNNVTRFMLREIIPLDDARLGAFRVMVIGLLLMAMLAWRPQGILGKSEELTLGR